MITTCKFFELFDFWLTQTFLEILLWPILFSNRSQLCARLVGDEHGDVKLLRDLLEARQQLAQLLLPLRQLSPAAAVPG